MNSAATATGARTPEEGPWQRYGWLMAVIWMVFLIFPALDLLESRAPLALRAVGWLGIALFAAAYVTGFVRGMRGGWRRPTRSVYAFFGAAVLAVALTLPAIGWDAAGFLPFLMAYAAYGLGTNWHWWVTGASLVIIAVDAVLILARGEQPPWFLVGIIVMMGAVNTINTWLIDRSVASDELRMELATSEERESVARDVHDLIGHSLTVVKLKAELAARLVDRDPAAARAELEEIARLTGEAIAGVRGTVTGLRSGGLAEQLRASISVLEAAGIEVEAVGEADALSPAQALPAAWIVREATTNALRHSRARRVRIEVEPGTVVFEDDGVGVRGRPGNGLRGMAERAAAAGALLRIEKGDAAGRAVAGSGTRVSLTW